MRARGFFLSFFFPASPAEDGDGMDSLPFDACVMNEIREGFCVGLRWEDSFLTHSRAERWRKL